MTRSEMVEIDGLSFNCRIDGREGGPWLVFSNSLATDLRIWDAQVARFGEDFQILRYDQRGHGGTQVPRESATIAVAGNDLIALLDHYGIAACTFVGLSMGMPTGLHVVDRQPRRIERLVLVDGQAATAPGGAANWEARISAAKEKGMARTAEETLARWFSPSFAESQRGREMLDIIASVPLEGFVACARALQAYDYRHVLPSIAVPTLLIAGANDGAMPENMRKLAAAIPGARFEEISGAGHIPNVEQPEAFNRLLEEFILR